MFDDIAWYWTHVASLEQVKGAQKDMAMSSIFLKQIVASQWNVLLEYVWAKLCEFEKELGKFEGKRFRKPQEHSKHLAETLAGVNLFRRRLSYYFDQVESNLGSLGIDVHERSNDEGKELLSILVRLQGCKEKVESLMPIVTGMLSVNQANISLEESKLVSKLTVVALIFIPLSFTASIFSMGGDFQPGSSHFWMYFAVALPLTSIFLVLAWWLRGKSLI
jgi:Mg2+ and Co2+ transporter CorA